MSTQYKPPNALPVNCKSVFLAGSIEMGAAENWQDRLVSLLSDTDFVFLNPRRDDWDSTWVQSKDNTQFREQVEWELAGLDIATKIALYFDPNTKSPISLLELGLYADSGRLVVCCPQGFWRKGNVDIVCAKYGVPMAESLEELAGLLSNPPQ